MRKRASLDRGYLIAYAINLLLNGEWFLIALVFFILSCVFNFPNFIWLTLLGIWLGWTAIVTFILSKLVTYGSAIRKPTKNVNPYSNKNADFSKTNKED